MSNQRPSFAKRDREMKLKDKARAKAEKRAAKRAEKAAAKDAPALDDPANIDGVTPAMPPAPTPTDPPREAVADQRPSVTNQPR
jgi:hypothetical protein